MLVTDPQLNVLATGPVLVVHQPDEVLDGMDFLEQEHAREERPDRAGARLAPVRGRGRARRRSSSSRRRCRPSTSPMCGNSICQDRRFLARWMPRLESLLPLPQPRRLHAEGAGEALEAGAQGLRQGRQARGARRHPRVDRGAEVLPQERDDDLVGIIRPRQSRAYFASCSAVALRSLGRRAARREALGGPAGGEPKIAENARWRRQPGSARRKRRRPRCGEGRRTKSAPRKERRRSGRPDARQREGEGKGNFGRSGARPAEGPVRAGPSARAAGPRARR